MPLIKSAKKALRRSRRQRVFNDFRRRALKEAVKKTRKILATDPSSAAAELALAYQAIDKAAKRGVIKKNTAARKKSRLATARRR